MVLDINSTIVNTQETVIFTLTDWASIATILSFILALALLLIKNKNSEEPLANSTAQPKRLEL